MEKINFQNSPFTLKLNGLQCKKELIHKAMLQLKRIVNSSPQHTGHSLAVRSSNQLIWMCWRENGSSRHKSINYSPATLSGSEVEQERLKLNEDAKLISYLLQQCKPSVR